MWDNPCWVFLIAWQDLWRLLQPRASFPYFSVTLTRLCSERVSFLDRQLCTTCACLPRVAEIHLQRARWGTIKRQRKWLRQEKTMRWTSGDLNRLRERIWGKCDILLLGNPMQREQRGRKPRVSANKRRSPLLYADGHPLT